MDKKLIIVESPTKVKTLKKILDKSYEIAASNGHIIDLPKNKLGIEIENNFQPNYVVIKNKEKIIENLKKLAKKAKKVLLASDPDREGESIAWHLSNVLKLPQTKNRIEFNEFTEKTIKNALLSPREIDIKKVNAQQARRILDRLVGYQISPILWQILGYSTSAGRVQSVALKLICDLEDEIKNFIPEKYWEVKGIFENNLELDLYKIGEEKENRLKNKETLDELKKETIGKDFLITTYKISKKSIAPPLPFKTSSLQQAASSELHFSPSRTMKIAQSLYEGVPIDGEPKGLITYMRTDSTRISEEAKKLAESFIEKNYGIEYVGKGRKEKAKKETQDAHECIRPTSMLKPEDIKKFLSDEQFKLYNLIFKRFITSRFANLDYNQLEVIAKYDKYEFRNTYNKIIFEGYYKILQENENFESEFPKLKEGQFVKLEELLVKEGETKPPVRYTEASLIKKLESEGIGRPSTYATIVETLKKRNYVELQEKKFVPTNLGYGVKKELIEHFPNIMNVKFTSKMEDNLDEIAKGNINWIEVLKKFNGELDEYLSKFKKDSQKIKNKTIHTDIKCEVCGEEMLLKSGRFGYYLACENKHKLPMDIDLINYDEIGKGKISLKGKLVTKPQQKNTLTDIECSECKSIMFLKKGKFGHYLECENKHKKSIPKDIKIESVNIENNKILLKNIIESIEKQNQKILATVGKCENCGSDMAIKKGKWGLFIGCTKYPECKNIKKYPKQ